MTTGGAAGAHGADAHGAEITGAHPPTHFLAPLLCWAAEEIHNINK